MTSNKLRMALYIYPELQRISYKLHKLDELSCDTGLTCVQKADTKRLEKEAEEEAQKIGFHAYHQGDPRGCTLYIVEDKKGDNIDHTDGIAIL